MAVPGAVAVSPGVELADGEARRGEKLFDRAFGPFGPMPYEVYYLVALIRLDPSAI